MSTSNSITLEQRVTRFIQAHGLVHSGQCLLLAVSGGADSVCLLYTLDRLRDELDIKLHIAHLDHQLRGSDSEADAAYVEETSNRLDIPLTLARADVKAYQQQHKLSLEEAAREVRYRFLAETANKAGAAAVATGHTRDDQVETILLHIIRGTGTRGLVGLKPLSRWQLDGKEITVVRPLLEISCQETEEYCNSRNLEPRLDETNLSLSPLRNRVRQQLLPLLREYNPAVDEALLRTSAAASEELAFLDAEAARIRDRVVQGYGQTIALDKKEFARLSPAIQRHLLRQVIEELLGSLKDIEACHIEEILAALDKPAGKQISLPWGLVFAVEYGRYLLGREPSELCPWPPLAGEHSLNTPGVTRIPGWRVTAGVIQKGETQEQGGDYVALIDLDKSGERLVVRSRRPGDRFRPLGLGGTKKLNQFMIDARIPRTWRSRLPLVCAAGQGVDTPGQVVWLAGYRLDERFKVTASTRRVLRLEFKPEPA